MDAEFRGRLEEAAHAVFGNSPIFLAYAFGSRTRGKPMPASDLDIGCYACEGRGERFLPMKEELALAVKLSDRIGTRC